MTCSTCGSYVCGRCHSLLAIRAAKKKGMSMPTKPDHTCERWTK